MIDHPSQWSYFIEQDLGMDVEAIKRSFASHIEYTQCKDEFSVTRLDFFQSLARVARDRMFDRWNETQQEYYAKDAKRIYYLSLEFLLGRLLRDGLLNLGILEQTRKALSDLGVDLDQVLDAEVDAGLGNGGLGRLAACFLDSMATLGLPATGYGIRYEFGIFRQMITNGSQIESPDNWLRYGSPWEIPRPECIYPVQFYGRALSTQTQQGRPSFEWVDTENVVAMAYDLAIPGFHNDTVNTLRLWAAKASRELDLPNFNQGDYVTAVFEKNATENISRVLYPNDKSSQGKELRLKQEYFFVSASLQDALRRHLKVHDSVNNLHNHLVFQLNDTHPALAVAELMRLLLDAYRVEWDQAWDITRQCFAYTNHTVMPEALENWSVNLFGRVLPRHLQIIFEINSRLLSEVRRRYPGDEARVQRMSIIQEGFEQQVRMANLAIVGSFSVNGVSKLHSRLLRERLFFDFAEFYPGKFNNKTNGITPRRWLLGCNPGLAKLITERIGAGWIKDLPQLEKLVPLADDKRFQAAWAEIKRESKRQLASLIERECGLRVNPDSLFDVQVKRIHEYKRQLLNVLHVLALYRRIKRQGADGLTPRTVVFGGKAAPGYEQAKRLIRLVNAVADLVNNDPEVNRILNVCFVPNYCVSSAEVIIPAADLSEQISTAGYEASGTGNMKFALNGALTIGTLDGANIEILEAVGDENIFIFGLNESEVHALKSRGYNPRAFYEADAALRDAMDFLASGALSPGEPGRFAPIVDSLLVHGDQFLVLADFASYRDTQNKVEQAYRDPVGWTRKSILNVARMGCFSSDLTIMNYAKEIWGVPVNVSSKRKK
jgi:starch phosphorylase